MLVHEARARLADRAPRFGDPEDRRAERLLALHAQAVARARRRLSVPEHLEKKLAEFEQANPLTLSGYLQPPPRRSKRRVCGG